MTVVFIYICIITWEKDKISDTFSNSELRWDSTGAYQLRSVGSSSRKTHLMSTQESIFV